MAQQKLNWQTCDFGDPAINATPGLSCAEILVPRDWTNPRNGKTWTLQISQVKNFDTSDSRYRGTIFTNPGGPGVNGVDWSFRMQQRAPRLAASHNFVGFEPRGTGAGSAAICTIKIDLASTDPLSFPKALAEGCATNEDVRTINSEQTAYDLDFMRHLMGLRTIDYAGYSYGTWLGSTYQRIFPDHAGQFLLDSSTDVTASSLQPTFENQPLGRDRQFRIHLMNYIARNDATYGLGEDPAAIYARYLDATTRVTSEAFSLAWLSGNALTAFPRNRFYPDAAAAVKAVIAAVQAGEVSKEPAATAASIVRRMAAAPADSRSTSRAELTAAAAKLDRIAALPSQGAEIIEAPATSPFDFIRCNDGQWSQDVGFWQDRVTRLAQTAPLSTSLGLAEIPACAFWKASSTVRPIPRRDYPETMVLQSEHDSQTYFEGGFNTGTRLPNTRVTFIDNEGSHGLFPYGTDCVDEPIYAFFERGVLPKRDVTICQAIPLPGESTTYESWTRLNRRGEPTTPVTSPFVPAPTERGKGRDRNRYAELPDVDAERIRSQVSRDVLARYGEKAVDVLGLTDATGVELP